MLRFAKATLGHDDDGRRQVPRARDSRARRLRVEVFEKIDFRWS